MLVLLPAQTSIDGDGEGVSMRDADEAGEDEHLEEDGGIRELSDRTPGDP